MSDAQASIMPGRHGCHAGHAGRHHELRHPLPASSFMPTSLPSLPSRLLMGPGGLQPPLNMPASCAAPSLPLSAVRHGIRQIEPQLQTMLRQTRTLTALVEVMPAISMVAGEAWEARRRLKRRLKITACSGWQRGDEGSGSNAGPRTTSSRQGAGTEKQRGMAAARSASLIQHVVSP